jgi:hypothetical protein
MLPLRSADLGSLTAFKWAAVAVHTSASSPESSHDDDDDDECSIVLLPRQQINIQHNQRAVEQERRQKQQRRRQAAATTRDQVPSISSIVQLSRTIHWYQEPIGKKDWTKKEGHGGRQDDKRGG